MNKVKPTGDEDCSNCAWDYEGNCNISEVSGYDGCPIDMNVVERHERCPLNEV
ncbi:MAG: hypothetical protein WC877_02080 [Dehalococcoidales bacterium]|jgi:hypothetical protein